MWPEDRSQILAELERELGIGGGMIYLLDVIPLIAIMWADGQNQPQEVALVRAFIHDHRERLRALADGLEVVDAATEEAFIARFVEQRPPQALLDALWALAHPLVFSSADEEENRAHGRRILDFCLDVAAACVTRYPYDARERFLLLEKDALRGLLGSLRISEVASVG